MGARLSSHAKATAVSWSSQFPRPVDSLTICHERKRQLRSHAKFMVGLEGWPNPSTRWLSLLFSTECKPDDKLATKTEQKRAKSSSHPAPSEQDMGQWNRPANPYYLVYVRDFRERESDMALRWSISFTRRIHGSFSRVSNEQRHLGRSLMPLGCHFVSQDKSNQSRMLC